jgi:hypothetical protein
MVVVAGAVPTVTANVADVLPQLLLNVTPTLPEAALALHVVVMLFVPWPAVIVTFAGTVHTYVAPLCATTLYTTPVVFGHTPVVPLIVAVVGALFTVTAKLPFVVPQLLVTATPTDPDAAAPDHVVVMLFVPCPAVMVTFAGTVHTYVTPACAVMLYVIAVAPAHNVAVPVTVGAVGALLLVTAKLPVVVPQLVDIDIPTFPEAAPAAHDVTIVLVPCPDVMLTFAGTVHV